MKYLWIFLLILSCDTVEDEYLWDENDDPEYERARELAISECISEAKIFEEFEELADFSTAKFDVGDIFKIKQDDNSAVIIYVKVNAISSTSIELIYDSQSSTYQKILTFNNTDHQSIVSFLKTASCNEEYKDVFTASGLTSTSQMSFTWKKQTIREADDEDDEDDEPEAYSDVTETLKVSTSFPLFFYYYNGTKNHEYIQEDGDDKVEKKSEITITEVTDEDECENGNEDQKTECDFDDLDTSDFPSCSIQVDEEAYDQNEHNTKMISVLTETGCSLLKSADIVI